MASQQVQDAATQLAGAAPWQSGSADSAMESLTQSLVDALKDATNSVNQLTSAQESGSGGVGRAAEDVLTSMIGGEGGLGAAMSSLSGGSGFFTGGGLLSPVIGGILSLFGAGGHSAPPPLTQFTLPRAIEVNATGGALTDGQLAGSDYDAAGLPRAQMTSSVTVQVNAMDSRSFMDRSSDIATAVRQAILSSHSINDVLAEL